MLVCERKRLGSIFARRFEDGLGGGEPSSISRESLMVAMGGEEKGLLA